MQSKPFIFCENLKWLQVRHCLTNRAFLQAAFIPLHPLRLLDTCREVRRFRKMHFPITLFYRLKSINMTALCLYEKINGCRSCLTVFWKNKVPEFPAVLQNAFSGINF